MFSTEASTIEEKFCEVVKASGHLQHAIAGHRVLVVHPHIRWGRNSAPKYCDPQLQLEEAGALIATLPTMNVAGSTIIGTDYSTNRKLIWGSGRIDQLRELKKQHQATAIMINVDQLQPNQQSSLHEVFQVPIFDRYNIVLAIFKHYARTTEAKLQIQLAEIPYIRHRLHFMLTAPHTSSHSVLQVPQGAPGPRGADRFEVLRLKEQLLRRKLRDAIVEGERNASKEISDGSLVAVVGYTNAGKTSLVKRLTGSDALQPLDRLFATLDTTRFPARLPSGRKVVFADTIGFLSNLPIHLLAAFEATLGHLGQADVVVHLRDVSNPDWRAQSAEVLSTLERVGVPAYKAEKVIHVNNKVDKLTQPFESEDMPDALSISCTTGEGVDRLITEIEKRVIMSTGCRLRRLALKLDSPGIPWLYKQGLVTKEPHNDANNRLVFDIFMTDAEFSRFQKDCARFLVQKKIA